MAACLVELAQLRLPSREQAGEGSLTDWTNSGCKYRIIVAAALYYHLLNVIFTGKPLDSSVDSDDVREDKDDEKEKEKPIIDIKDAYEYSARVDTGCLGEIKEKKAPSPLLDFGEECEVESQKLQDDRVNGEKGGEKDESASSSSEDEADDVSEKGGKVVASDSSSEEAEEKSPHQQRNNSNSSCYSSSEEEKERESEDEKDSEDDVAIDDKHNDGQTERMIKKDDSASSCSEDEQEEKEVSEEKHMVENKVSQDDDAVEENYKLEQEIETASLEAGKNTEDLFGAEIKEEPSALERQEATSGPCSLDSAPPVDFCLMTEKPTDQGYSLLTDRPSDDSPDFCLMTDKPSGDTLDYSLTPGKPSDDIQDFCLMTDKPSGMEEAVPNLKVRTTFL